jgi:hypothetical protein
VPLTGSGTTTDPRRPVLVPSEAETAASQTAAGTATAQASNRPVTATAVVPDLLGYTLQLSDDGKSALVEFTFSSPVGYHNFLVKAAARQEISASTSEAVVDIAKLNSGQTDGTAIKNLAAGTQSVQAAVQAAVPGLQLFERGKVTEAQILAAFQKAKASFTLANPAPTTQGVAQ